jgi:putative phosphoesterase
MRVAIVSDIHGNLTAFEAVLRDLKRSSPDLVLHGGDLAQGGSSPAEIVDRVRELGWQGVLGNADEMLFAPETLAAFAAQSSHLRSLFTAISGMADWTREKLGDERCAWLASLPREQIQSWFALVHASPESTWRAPAREAADTEFERIYAPLGRPLAVYGHIHRPFIRRLDAITVINSGSAGLSYDGDPRASYLLLEDTEPTIRRVDYDLDAEIQRLSGSGTPHSDWIARSLASASFVMP